MAFSRAAAIRACFRGARPTAARPQIFRQIARRGYASGGHDSAKAGGDAIWAAGAIAVTVPTCWYLLSNAPDTSHGHGDHGDDHGKSHGKKEESEEPKDEPEEESEGKSEESGEDDKDSEKSEDSDSGDEDKAADTPDTSEDEGEADTKEDGKTKKSVPDAKGGSKKRIESDKGEKQGDLGKEGGNGEPKDKPSASKEPLGEGSQSSKQEGLSNTDTKHSTDISSNPDKSKKSEGSPDTAKSKGTVDPKRPQV